MRSIERLLLAWVLGALTLGAAALVGVSYWLTLDELDEVFDENLKQVALATAYHNNFSASIGSGLVPAATPIATPSPPYAGGPASSASASASTSAPATDSSASPARRRPLLPRLPRIYDSEGDFDFITLVWQTADRALIFTSDPTVTIPYLTQTGVRHLMRPDGEWHIYTIVQPDIVVQAAQRESSRNVLAAEVASKMFVPLAALVVLIGVLLVLALRYGLRSLDHAAASVAQRSADTLQPVTLMGMPREIHPLVHAINDLLSRLSIAFVTQKRFVADAAHELRTPVTALRLQLQLLERARDDGSRTGAVRDLKKGIERSQHLIEQLLNLSRVEPDPIGKAALNSPETAPTDLGELVRDVVASMSIKAEHRGIDLGAEGDEVVLVDADHEQLLVLLNNLVENALRYTPGSGVIDVRATRQHGKPMLQVIDSGPGIPPEQRKRVFDRFYRGDTPSSDAGDATGSGLGLAIVKAIADRHRAHVSLHSAPNGSGLEVRVVFS